MGKEKSDKICIDDFGENILMTKFQSTFEYKLIYVFRINDKTHSGLLKIGDATVHTNKNIEGLAPNCHDLNQAAKARINMYTVTAGIEYDLLHTELAIYKTKGEIKVFRDKKVHDVLMRSGIKRHMFNMESKGQEWFETDLETAKKAIIAVKNGQQSLNPNDVTVDKSPIIFRPEQNEAIEKTVRAFKSGDRMLWNAKMRFGKTLSALEVAKRSGFKKTLIFTHRPVVSDGWFEDFHKIFNGTNYKFGSKTFGESIEKLIDKDEPFVYFASIQDLRGSQAVGGKFDKNEYIFLIDWDYLIVDEAHEGTQTTLGQRVLEMVLSNNPDKKPKLLELSGTPFNLLASFKENEIYTWDYIMEQRAKEQWALAHFGDSNPYEELPKLEIFTYDLDKLIPGYIDIQDSAFNFREFFRTWTGDIKKDFKPVPDDVRVGDFVHKDDVWAFLNLLSKADNKNNFPFSTEEYRSYYRHTLWMLPGVKEARALSAMLKTHPVFGSGAFNIVNVAGDGDEEENYKNALNAVRTAIGKNPDDGYSITLSCGRLTTGVTVPEWTAVFMLAGSFSTSAANYLQTIFRVQTPANINGRMKERCSVFDFAPDRALKMVAEARQLSTKAGNTGSDRIVLGEFLNFCPVIAITGATMSEYNVDSLLQQLKKAYTERVVRNGFDDKNLYNDNLLKLDDIDLAKFEELKKIIGATKQAEKVEKIDVNNQGFTDEEYAELERIEKKPKKERTAEEIAFLEERKKKRDNAQKAMSILRGISIRIPLLIYGAEVPFDKDITVENFTDIIDDSSWEEFMPTGITKEKYKEFAKYYEQDVFVAAGRHIRNMARAADDLAPTERVKRIAEIFSQFKNPDKETVLTPWRVVNMHMSECLGGYRFYDETFEATLSDPVFVDRRKVTEETFANPDAKILEINSKTGLYPLYVVYSIFRTKIDSTPVEKMTDCTVWDIWKETVENNLFVICKTPMAKAITKRTLLGYKQGKINAHAFDDLINQLKSKPEQFKEKVLRGSFWNKECKEMKFDAVVGNPPYQETTGGTVNDKPIYNLFMDVAFSLSEKVSFITPARFLFNAGATPQEWNDRVLNDKHFRVIKYTQNSTDVFPNVDIKGGVAVTYRDEKQDFGKIGIYTAFAELNSIKNKVWEVSQTSLMDVVLNRGQYRYSDKAYLERPDSLAKTPDRRISTSAFERMPELFVENKPKDGHEYIQMYGNIGSNRVYRWFRKDYLAPIDNLYKYKVMLPKANGSGAIGEVLSTPLIGSPLIGYTETYISVGETDSLEQAEAVLKYIKSKFARCMLGILKVTQDNTKKVWQFVPMQDFTENSDIDWSKSIPEIDSQLYAKYNLTEEEISFIESMIKPME